MPEKKLRDNDTIAAVATPMGPGGIGIVRVSGPLSPAIFRRVFKPAGSVTRPASHRLYYGRAIDPENQEALIDEALAVIMYSPHSYTREDVLEIQCHSGPAVVNRILKACLSQGARLAEPGEFTRRAFLNGRIDLSQAEAVLDLTTAGADAAGAAAATHLEGGLSQRIKALARILMDVLAAVEVAIDYPEEDVEISDEFDLEKRLRHEALPGIRELEESHERAIPYREGLDVLIVGRPNVGKSSLLNSLCSEERAIVSPVPGTTRDMVEAQIRLKGMLVRLTDTAGIRQNPDMVEAIGIKRIAARVPLARLALWVLDSSAPITPEDFNALEVVSSLARRGRVLAVFNKMDKVSGPWKKTASALHENLVKHQGMDHDIEWIAISVLTGSGIDGLMEKMAEKLLGEDLPEPPVWMPNLRQKMCLQRAREAIERAANGFSADFTPELTAIDLKTALDALGEITGETATDDILNHIFSNFCLGK